MFEAVDTSISSDSQHELVRCVLFVNTQVAIL
jgi:hypothetical protein